MNKEEQNYLDLMQDILDNGVEKPDRTNTGTRSVFGRTMRFNLDNNTLPLITTKKVFFRGIFEELLFFLRGEHDTKKLEAKGIKIWTGNTSKEFQNKVGLEDLKEGSLGVMYGVQWRNWGTTKSKLHLPREQRGGTDQIANLIDNLKNNPDSRRLLVSAWNATDLDNGVLNPCHYAFQCYVNNGELSLMFNCRSQDFFLGTTFNIASYALLTHILAKVSGLKAKELIWVGGDVHLYSNHIEQAKLQISREPYPFPQIKINKQLDTLENIESLQFEDIEVIGYQSHSTIKAEMAI